MNKKILPFARLMGDVSLSINGENKVSFSVGGEWVNNYSLTYIGDRGCLFPTYEEDDGIDGSAINVVALAMSNISIVPFQNDSSYEKYASEGVNTWFKETLPALILKEFREKPEVFKIEAQYTPEGEVDPIVVVHVEIRSNKYVNSFFEQLRNIELMGIVGKATITDDGDVTYEYKDSEGEDKTFNRNMTDKIWMVGLDGLTKATHLYGCDDDHVIITNGHFIPVIEESKVVKFN